MKKILLLLLISIISLASAGCSSEKIAAMEATAEEIMEEKKEIEYIQEDLPFEMRLLKMDDHFYLYENSISHTLFLVHKDKAGYAGMGGLIELTDPDTGLPLTYDRYIELCENAEMVPEIQNITKE